MMMSDIKTLGRLICRKRLATSSPRPSLSPYPGYRSQNRLLQVHPTMVALKCTTHRPTSNNSSNSNNNRCNSSKQPLHRYIYDNTISCHCLIGCLRRIIQFSSVLLPRRPAHCNADTVQYIDKYDLQMIRFITVIDR